MARDLRETEEARCLGLDLDANRSAAVLEIDSGMVPCVLVEASRILENDRVNVVSGICEVN